MRRRRSISLVRDARSARAVVVDEVVAGQLHLVVLVDLVFVDEVLRVGQVAFARTRRRSFIPHAPTIAHGGGARDHEAVNQDDVRRIALSLPEVREDDARFSFYIPDKGRKKHFVWVWLERIDPKKGRVPNPAVIGVRVADEDEKHELCQADPEKFFTEPHYNGYPAVLVRLDAVDEDELAELLTEGWRCQAPKRLLATLDSRPEA